MPLRLWWLLPLLALSCGSGDAPSAAPDAGAEASTMDAWRGEGVETGAGDAGSSDAGAIDAGTGDADATAPATGGAWVMAYYAGYDASKLPVTEIAWGSLTHVAVAFYLPDGSGGIDESLFIDPVNGPKLGHALVTAAHANGKKAIASVGGAGVHDMFAASASSATRAAFVTRIAKLVGDYGYDGVDLDWEPIQAGDDVPLAALARDLKAALPGKLLTLPIDQSNANSPPDLSYLATMAPLFDRISVMSYGMSGAYSGWKSWHSSPLHWNGVHETPAGIDTSVALVLRAGVPAAKLGIGAGFYGLCYTAPVNAPVQALGAAVVKDVVYDQIVQSYLSPAARLWDDGAKVPYLSFAQPHGPDACTFLSYEDAQSIGEKATYAKSSGLGAIIVWTMNQGYLASAPAGQRQPLLDALGNGFLH